MSPFISSLKCRKCSSGLFLAFLPVIWVSTGCTTGAPTVQFQSHRTRVDVDLYPTTSFMQGRVTMDLYKPSGVKLPEAGPIAVEFTLHPSLSVTRVVTAGADLHWWPVGEKKRDDEESGEPRTYRVFLENPVEALTLFITYEGVVHQDVEEGEVMGQVHNFAMRAHISDEGIYLAGASWYPELTYGENQLRPLTDYILTAGEIEGFKLIASGETDRTLTDETGRLAWRSPYPLDGMALVGGPLEVHSDVHNNTKIDVYLRPESAQHAPGLLRTIKVFLDRYEPLLGSYPANEYAVVENFFSSGFAFPTFNLMSTQVINMGPRGQMRHGMFDHELVHSWLGNGVFVRYTAGNWCEALTSYCTNYYGFVLDGDEKGARRKRMNFVHFLSRMDEEKDKPLATFGLENGASRSVGYDKGAFVFHMLARQIGQDVFWRGVQRFIRQNMGEYASWVDLQEAFEVESGEDLSYFFEQWVYGRGAPRIEINYARYDPTGRMLQMEISQGEDEFDLDLPVRLVHENGELDLIIPLNHSALEVMHGLGMVPHRVMIDPDYHVFRRISLDEVMPTTAKTRYGDAFASVVPAEMDSEQYGKMKEWFASAFEEDERIELIAGDIEEGALAERCVLILGDAALDPYVSGFLTAIDFPVRFMPGEFEYGGTVYSDPSQAVMCTARHPGVEGGGVTVIFANSANAVPRAQVIPYYPYSMVVFQGGMRKEFFDFERLEGTSITHLEKQP